MTNKNFFAAFVAAVIALSSFTAVAATPVTKVFTKDQGTIISAAITYVPADDEKKDCAKKCILIQTTKGAKTVVFPLEQIVPSNEQLLRGYFTVGNFGEKYNSAYFTEKDNHGQYPVGKWAPAIAKDFDGGVRYTSRQNLVRRLKAYSTRGMECAKNLALTPANAWNCGYRTSHVEGYYFVVAQGELVIKFNDREVMRLQ